MNSWLFSAIMVGFWGLNLLNGTGLGSTYHISEISWLVAVLLASWLLGKQMLREKGLYASRRYLYVLLPMSGVFAVSAWLNGFGLSAFEYLWAYLVVYIFSRIRTRKEALRLAGFFYAGLGAAILCIYNYMDALDGWNANSIAMVGLFSFMVFIIPYFGATDRPSRILLPIAALVYAFLLEKTGSRSCMMIIIVCLLVIFGILPVKKFLYSGKWIFAVLLVPLVVAAGTVLLAGTEVVQELNSWSLQEFNKPIFNGRDEIWRRGFQRLGENVFFGTGRIQAANWHNSAVECLVSFGVVGFFLWVKSFYTMLCDARRCAEDVCVAGAMVAFLAIYCQQSVELGLMARNPNLLPYVILGVMLGRIKYLKENQITGHFSAKQIKSEDAAEEMVS